MPSCAALMAATYPPGPPPMTTRSYGSEAVAKPRDDGRDVARRRPRESE